MAGITSFPHGVRFTIEVRGTRFNCRTDGRRGAPWLAFSNSLATDLSLWDDQVAAFAADYCLFRYDQRGHGGSAMPAGPCNFDVLSDDLLALLDAMGIETVALIGISMGAVTVLKTAIRQPQRCALVVASDTSWSAPPQAVDLWQARIALALEKGMQALEEPTFTRWTGRSFAQRRPEAAARVRNMISRTSVDGFVGCATALQRYDIQRDCENLRRPVLYIVGAEDGSLPRTMKDMHRSTPGSQFIEIADAGHLPNIEQPEAFNAAVAAFLTGASRVLGRP